MNGWIAGQDDRRSAISPESVVVPSSSWARAGANAGAAQRRFGASMIALRPAVLSVRFLLAGLAGEAARACFPGRGPSLALSSRNSGTGRSGHPASLGRGCVISGTRAQHLAKFGNLRVESFLLFFETGDGRGEDLGREF